MLEEIEKGKHGWKVRRLEILIMESMQRATKPNTGWDVYQKLKRKVSTSGDEVCTRMKSLSDRALLRIVGNDNDCGYMYERVDK